MDDHDIKVEPMPGDHTGFYITATVAYGLEAYVGRSAGELRGLGLQTTDGPLVKDTTPDCAVLQPDGNGGYEFHWVSASFTIKADFGGDSDG